MYIVIIITILLGGSTMAMTFDERIERFVGFNELHAGRVHTDKAWFSLQGTIVFDTGALDKLVIPNGLHMETDYLHEEFPEQKCYFLVDDESGEYVEIMESKAFWAKYAEELELMRDLDDMYVA